MSEANRSPIDIYIGHKIKTHRIEVAKATLKDISDAMGVSYQQIQNYERGISTLSAPRLFQLAQIFSLSPNYFMPESFEEAEAFAKKLLLAESAVADAKKLAQDAMKDAMDLLA